MDPVAALEGRLPQATELLTRFSPAFVADFDQPVQLTVTVQEYGGPAAGKTVSVDGASPREQLTNANGEATFELIAPPGGAERRHTVRVDRVETEVWVPFMKVAWELDPTTGVPFEGLVADGSTTLVGELSLPGASAVSVSAMYGSVERVVTLDETGTGRFEYTPPAYLPVAALSEAHTMDGEAYWGMVDVVTLSFTDVEQTRQTLSKELRLLRPSVFLVHGFTGNSKTWENLAKTLRAKSFRAINRDYLDPKGTPSTIEGQAEKLLQELRDEHTRWTKQGIKPGRVDVIAHSMGGLIARQCAESSVDCRPLIRKLIMVGTPNHGVGLDTGRPGTSSKSWGEQIDQAFGRAWKDPDLQAGATMAYAFDTHAEAADQMHYDSAFLAALNAGEETGKHLNPEVQYLNLIGRRSWVGAPSLFGANDWVVYNASSHLAGVAEELFESHVHSTVFANVVFGPLDTALTESPAVFERLVRALQEDIPPAPLDGQEVALSRHSGEVSVRSGTQVLPVKTAPRLLESRESVLTGPGASAVVLFSLKGNPWGAIALRENSEVRVLYASPNRVWVELRRGAATFRSVRNGATHFQVDVEALGLTEIHPHARVVGLDTAFVVELGEGLEVEGLEGRTVTTPIGSEAALPSVFLAPGQRVRVQGEGAAERLPRTSNPWWTDAADELPHADPPPNDQSTLRLTLEGGADVLIAHPDKGRMGLAGEALETRLEGAKLLESREGHKVYEVVGAREFLDALRIEVSAQSDGEYTLWLELRAADGASLGVVAQEIPLVSGQRLSYEVDWDGVASGAEDAVRADIDVDGDGEFDEVVHSASAFDGSMMGEATSSTPSTADEDTDLRVFGFILAAVGFWMLMAGVVGIGIWRRRRRESVAK